MNSEEFHIVLPSTASKKEFTNNTANQYKVRLPQQVRLTGNQWRVGLASISLPDSEANVYDLVSETTTLMAIQWSLIKPVGAWAHHDTRLTLKQLKGLTSVTNGEQFMRVIVDALEQARLKTGGSGASFETSDGEKLYSTFRWVTRGESSDLLVDNNKIHFNTTWTNTPKVSIHMTLALKMGWVKKKEGQDAYELGPNLLCEAHDRTYSTDPNVVKVMRSEKKEPISWKVTPDKQYMLLSAKCNWRFSHLNNAFQSIGGSPNRSLYIYSSVGSSIIVGGQMVDMLREVQYKRESKGTTYFEPLRIQYHPVRNPVIDVIEVQIAETDGTLANLSPNQPTSLTLTFKNGV